MKKLKPSLFYFFALVALSHPSFAQEADTETGPAVENLQPTKIHYQAPPKLDPPIVSLKPIFPSTMPVLPAPAAPNVVVAPVPEAAAKIANRAASDTPPVVSLQPMWPTKLPELPMPALPNVVLRHDEVVSSHDLKSMHIKLKFDGKDATLAGSLPKACVDAMKMDVTEQDRTEKDSSDDDSKEKVSHSLHKSKKGEIASQEDLDANTVVYGVRVIYQANEKYNTLADCNKGEQATDLKALSSSDKLKKSAVIDDKDYARLGFMDGSGQAVLTKDGPKSASYRAMESVFGYVSRSEDDKPCAVCDFDPNKVREANDIIKNQKGVSSDVISAHVAIGLNEDTLKTNLNNIKDMKGIRNFRDILRDYASLIPSLHLSPEEKNNFYGLIETYYGKLQEVVGEVVKNQPTHANQYAALIAENAKIMAGTPGMSEQFHDEQIAAHRDYQKGGSRYYEFVAAYDPGSLEVRAFMSKYSQPMAEADAMLKGRMCTAVVAMQDRNPRDINACASAQASLAHYQKIVGPVASRINTSQVLPQMTTQNSFGSPGAQAPAGSRPLYASNSGGSMVMAQNGNPQSLFTLNPQVFQTANQFSPNAPSYMPPSSSQYQLGSPTTVAVPLNPAINPGQNAGSSAPAYFSINT